MADDGPKFPRPTFADPDHDVYRWMGFEAYDLLHGVVEEAIADQSVTVDFFAYDLDQNWWRSWRS